MNRAEQLRSFFFHRLWFFATCWFCVKINLLAVRRIWLIKKQNEMATAMSGHFVLLRDGP